MATLNEDKQSATIGLATVPAIENDAWKRWLAAGWRDVVARPGVTIVYGGGFAAVSWGLIAILFALGLEWMLLPALAGAMLMGPLVATGLYQISRNQQTGVVALPAATSQIGLLGAILLVVLLAWVRIATIVYALFFGLTPFPGFAEKLALLFTTTDGISMVLVGSAIGGIFAAFTFAITAFSIPMLVVRDIDAFTAMARSFSAVTHNVGAAIRWGAAITVLSLIGFATALIGMIVVFPWLGFATWHAYVDVFGDDETP